MTYCWSDFFSTTLLQALHIYHIVVVLSFTFIHMEPFLELYSLADMLFLAIPSSPHSKLVPVLFDLLLLNPPP
jgi:hypothetical protein